jgi:uncharacterized membrane protein affecting hemolysin expression
LRVKRLRRELLLAAAVSCLVGTSILSLHDHDTARAADDQALGQALAAGLARLAVEPLANRDRIALGVLANRLVALDQINGITVYTVDDEMLAISGDTQRGQTVTEAITRDNSVVGYVRIMLAAPAGASGTENRWMAIAVMSFSPLLLVALWQLPWQQFRLTSAHRKINSEIHLSEPEPAAPVAHTLLAVNLFNQLTLKPELRDRELSHAHHVAEAVAERYDAEVVSLPGTGLLLHFAGSDAPDRPYQTLCAAFLLARLLFKENSHGQYRLGLHTVMLVDDEEPLLEMLEVQDTALLSAVARPATLAVSHALFQSIPDPSRVVATPMRNRLLNQLESTAAEAWLVSGVDEFSQLQIEQHADNLSYSSAAATPSESTF